MCNFMEQHIYLRFGFCSLFFPAVSGAQLDDTRGFCLVDIHHSGGITPLLQPSIISLLPLPESFKELDVYYDHPYYMTSPVSFLMSCSNTLFHVNTLMTAGLYPCVPNNSDACFSPIFCPYSPRHYH